MHMLGGPAQHDMFDYKPKLASMYDQDLPDSVRDGQRLTEMTANQKRFPIASTVYKFKQHGECGMWMSDLIPHTAKMADDMCFVRSMFTDAINHDPACTLMQTGNQITGRPSVGSWVSYGLGSQNADLPTFAVMVAQANQPTAASRNLGTTLVERISPGEHSGVNFRTAGDPILYIDNPKVFCRRSPCDARRFEHAQQDAASHSTMIQRPARAFSNMKWRSECNQVCRTCRSEQRDGSDAQDVRRRGQEARLIRQVGIDGAPHDRTWRSVYSDLSQQLGHT